MKKSLSAFLSAMMVFSLASPVHAAEPEVVTAEGTQQVVLVGEEWGAGVTKTILHLNKDITSASLSKDDFVVTETNGYGAVSERTIVDAYLSDANGDKLADATSGAVVTIEMAISPSEGNPITWDGTNWRNSWGAYSLDVALVEGATLETATEVVDTLSIPARIDVANDRLCPQLDGVTIGSYTYNGQAIPYGYYEPAEDGHKNPIIIWNHGVGECGTDPQIAMLGNEVTALFGSEFQETLGGCYVLVPQMTGMSFGNTANVKADGIVELVKELAAENSDIDLNRVLVAGCSMGGGTTSTLINRHADFFAAAVPICPASAINPANPGVVDVPVWFVQAENDGTVKPAGTHNTEAACREAGMEVHASYFENVKGTYPESNYDGHWSWVYFFNNEVEEDGLNCWEWLATQSRANSIAEGTQTLVVTGDDWGAPATSTILELNKAIDPASVDVKDFVVNETKEDWSETGVGTVTRTVIAAYTSDEEGNKVEEASNYVTLEFATTPDDNVFKFDLASFSNNYSKVYDLDVQLAPGATLVSGQYTIKTLTVESEIALSNETIKCPQLEKFDLGVYTTEGKENIPYAFYTPVEDNHKNALVIWLHGAGERGNNPAILLLANEASNLASDEFQTVFDGAYVLAPQVQVAAGNWSMDGLYELITTTIEEHPDIDADRVIVGGCSMGGGNTMSILFAHPELFAAAYPICPATDNSKVTDEMIESLKDVAIWFTHAENDGSVKYEGSTKALAPRLQAAGCDVHATVWPDVHDTTGRFFDTVEDTKASVPHQYDGHWSWVYFFNNDNNTDTLNGVEMNEWEWLAQQTRADKDASTLPEGANVDGKTVTFVYEDTDERNAVSVTVSGNLQWYKVDDPACANYTKTLDYSKAVSYDAYEYEKGMFNTGYGLNGDMKVYELKETANERFELTLTLPGNLYYYDYTVTYADGSQVTMQDPANPSPANPANGHDAGHSLFYIYNEEDITKGQEKIYPRTDKQTGSYEFIPYKAADGTTQYLEVYTPYGYKAKAKDSYPTIYVSHGGGGQEAEWMSIGAIPNIMDNLVADGETLPAVVVTMDNTYWGWDYAKINKNLMENIIPTIEGLYNVSSRPEDRAFCGLSMGGLTTTNVWKSLADQFAYLGIWSATEGDLDVSAIPNKDFPTLMLSCGIVDFAAPGFYGNGDPAYPGLIKILDDNNMPYILRMSNGAHDWGVWRDLFTFFADEVVWTKEDKPTPPEKPLVNTGDMAPIALMSTVMLASAAAYIELKRRAK